MSGRQEQNESGERKGGRERKDGEAKQDSTALQKDKHQTHFHDLPVVTELQPLPAISNQGQPEQIKLF